MKYQFFFLFWLIIGVVLSNLATKVTFNVNLLSLISWWYKDGDNKVLVIFMAGLGSLVSLVLISGRSYDTYLSFVGEPESYVFVGEKLQEGFYGYRENDPERKIEFIPSFTDTNVYPITSFNSLYHRNVILRGAQGDVIKVEFFYLGTQIIWGLASLITFMFGLLGFLMLLKNFGEAHQHLQSAQGIGNIWGLLNKATGGKLLLTVYLLIGLHIVFILAVRWNVRNINNDGEKLIQLPASLKSGNILMGTVIASDKYRFDKGSDRSVYDARFHKRYTIRFDEKSGLNTPVYINWDEWQVNEGNLTNASKSLKRELKMRMDYYGSAFEYLDAAKDSGIELPFFLTEDLCPVPYLEEKSELLSKLLASQ